MITHIDDGLDFLGWRIQRHRKRGTDRSYVYTYPRRRRCARSRGRSRRCAGRPARTCRYKTCYAGSTRYWQAGAPAFGPRCHPRRSITWPTSPGGRSSDGCVVNTPDHLEGPPPTLLRQRLVADHTALGAVRPGKGLHDPVPIPGRSDPHALAGQGMTHHRPNGACGEPDAQRWARRVREAGRGNPPVKTPTGRPVPTSHLPPVQADPRLDLPEGPQPAGGRPMDVADPDHLHPAAPGPAASRRPTPPMEETGW